MFAMRRWSMSGMQSCVRLYRTSSLVMQSSSSSSSVGQQDTLQWLVQQKHLSETIALKMMKVFPNTPTISEIQLLGDAGFKALVEAIEREEASKPTQREKITIYIDVPKERHSFPIEVNVGENLYDVRQHSKELEKFLECACQGIAACSTCHVYVRNPEDRKKLPLPEDNELDMLDLAWGVKKSSRLGCQIKFTKALDGLKITIPDEANNLFN